MTKKWIGLAGCVGVILVTTIIAPVFAASISISATPETATAAVDQKINFSVAVATEGGTTTPGTIVEVFNESGGQFFNGNLAGECNNNTPDADGRFAIQNNKAICFSSPIAGEHIIGIQLLTEGGDAIGEAQNITVTVLEPGCEVQTNTVTETSIQNTTTGDFFDTIQAAIDDCDTEEEHVIAVAGGVYQESLVINKEVTISGVAASKIVGTVRIESSNVTFTGFTLTQADQNDSVAIVIPDTATYDSVLISNVSIKNFTSSENTTGIFVDAGTNIVIDTVVIDGLTSTAKTAQGILLGGTGSPVDVLSDITVTNVAISNITGTPGAFGVTVNEPNTNLTITDSTFMMINGGVFAVGIGLDAPTANAEITQNIFSQMTAGTFPPVAVNANEREGNTEVDSITLARNNFMFASDEGVVGANHDFVGETESQLIATENFWNDPFGPAGELGSASSSGALMGVNTVFDPWLCAAHPDTELAIVGVCSVTSAVPEEPEEIEEIEEEEVGSGFEDEGSGIIGRSPRVKVTPEPTVLGATADSVAAAEISIEAVQSCQPYLRTTLQPGDEKSFEVLRLQLFLNFI